MRPRRRGLTAVEHTNWSWRLSRLLVAALLLLLAPSAASAVTVIQTTENLHDALTIQPPQRFTARRAPGSAVIRVDSRVRYQRISGFGAAMNRLSDAQAAIQSTSQNLSAALATVQDVNVATETANLAREQVLAQAGASVLAQANQAPQLALKLLQ